MKGREYIGRKALHFILFNEAVSLEPHRREADWWPPIVNRSPSEGRPEEESLSTKLVSGECRRRAAVIFYGHARG